MTPGGKTSAHQTGDALSDERCPDTFLTDKKRRHLPRRHTKTDQKVRLEPYPIKDLESRTGIVSRLTQVAALAIMSHHVHQKKTNQSELQKGLAASSALHPNEDLRISSNFLRKGAKN